MPGHAGGMAVKNINAFNGFVRENGEVPSGTAVLSLQHTTGILSMTSQIQERRKSKRYSILLRVYFPEFKLEGFASNISLDGCFVETVSAISEGFLTDLYMELPVVGVIAMKGYVQHTGQNNEGVGMEFVHVRFEEDQSEYFSIYSRFVKLLPQLEDIRGSYEQLVEQGRITRLEIPSPA